MKQRAGRTLMISLIVLALGLSGCGSFTVSFRSGTSDMLRCGQQSMKEAEVRLIALQYKCRFESYYSELLGDSFWETEVSEGITFEAYVKEYFVYRECKALLYLGRIAENRKLSIDEFYDSDFRTAAENYMSSLSKDEQRFTGADVSDAESLMRRYALAGLVIDEELSGNVPEVSDEESRVADIEIIRVSDQELANDLSARLKDGESFLTLAQENTLDSRIDYSVYRGELIPVLDELVFSMNDYDISEVTEAHGSYYLVRLVNSYNVLLSANRKSNMVAEKKYLAWESLYESEERKITILRNNQAYEKLTLSKTGDFPAVDLFGNIPVIN